MTVSDDERDLPIRCTCGTLRGVLRGISSARGNRGVCYCDDCQSFAHFLGRPAEILDEHGGTEVFQTSPARVEIAAGADRLACIRLTPKGLLRWYASCCRTPIGNTLATPKIPFVGLVRACLAADDAALESVLGPVRYRGMGRFAKGDISGLDVRERFSLGSLARVTGIIVGAKLRGDARRSPFFDAANGEPVAAPNVLSEEELRRIETARDRYAPSSG